MKTLENIRLISVKLFNGTWSQVEDVMEKMPKLETRDLLDVGTIDNELI